VLEDGGGLYAWADVMIAYIITDHAFGTGGGQFPLIGSYLNIDGGNNTFATSR
jgi:hypothetical protein